MGQSAGPRKNICQGKSSQPVDTIFVSSERESATFSDHIHVLRDTPEIYRVNLEYGSLDSVG